MDYQNKEMLDNKIAELLCDFTHLNAGSEERSRAVKELETLWKMSIEADKVDSETGTCEVQVAENKKDRYVKIGIAAAEVILPLAFYAVWLSKGMKFEETGSFTSTTFKGLINRFRPTK